MSTLMLKILVFKCTTFSYDLELIINLQSKKKINCNDKKSCYFLLFNKKLYLLGVVSKDVFFSLFVKETCI